MKRAKSAKRRLTNSQPLKAAEKQPFFEHVRELRRRLFYVAVSVILFSCAAYGVEHHIVDALLKPAEGQKFIYTSPGGGIDFLFRVCLYVGIACSIPVIVYQLLRYLEPLLKISTRRAVAAGAVASGILAAIGMVFGYYVGLPAALHFLLHQFVTAQIQPLITIQSYMSFVSVYMLGSALLLQIPLILLIINRIKPLKPQKLLSFNAERWVIVASLVGGALMNPNPNPIALLMVSAPLIGAYQIGVLIIWIVNRKRQTPVHIKSLLDQDAETRAQRQAAAKIAQPLHTAPARSAVAVRQAAPRPATASIAAVKPKLAHIAVTPAPAVRHAEPIQAAAKTASITPQQSSPRPQRPQRYINDFVPRRPAAYRAPKQFPEPDGNIA